MALFNAKKEGICGQCGSKFSVGEQIRGPYFIGGKRVYFGTTCHKDKRTDAQRKKSTTEMFEKREAFKKGITVAELRKQKAAAKKQKAATKKAKKAEPVSSPPEGFVSKEDLNKAVAEAVAQTLAAFQADGNGETEDMFTS